MKLIDCKMRSHFKIQDSINVRNATKIIKIILDANYKKAILKKTFKNIRYQSNNEQFFILRLLQKRIEMFDGTLGNYTGKIVKLNFQKEPS